MQFSLTGFLELPSVLSAGTSILLINKSDLLGIIRVDSNGLLRSSERRWFEMRMCAAVRIMYTS